MRRIALALALVLTFVVSSTASAHWPVVNRYAHVSQWYSSGHRAIDIASPKWTRVVPLAGGWVVFAGWRHNGGGYQVWVRHNGGVYSAYYHLAREITYVGEYLSEGREVLGYVGSTGNSTGPHLHVEVWRGFPWRWGSYRINPWRYINHGTYLPYRYR